MLDFYAMRALDYFKKEKNKRYKTNLKSYALNNEGIKYEEKEKV